MSDFVEINPGLWYEEKTGKPFSTKRSGSGNKGRTDFPLRALKAETNGYYRVRINGKTARYHRLVYEFFESEIPEKMVIDHIDGNKSNNLISNLQVLSVQKNLQKMTIVSSNKSGFPGVHWHKTHNKWFVSIRTNGKPKHLGSFTSKLSAYSAYLEAKVKYHGPKSIKLIPSLEEAKEIILE